MAAVVSDDSGKGRGSTARARKDGATGVGEILRVARERHGLTLEQLSRETKIPLRHLEALEQDNLAALPGPFYQRAEIRTFARAVKLDPNLVLARLERGPAPSVSETAPESSTVPRSTRSGTQLALIAAGVVLMAMVFRRVMPREPSFEGQTHVGSAADSTRPNVSARGETASDAALAIQRTDFDQVPPPSTSTDRELPAGIEPVAARPSVVADRDVPAASDLPAKSDLSTNTKPADERAPVGVATELVVATEPAGARVTVDGIGWGITPVTIRHLAPGNKRIRVTKEGYATAERVVWIAEGQRKTTEIPLPDEP